MAKEIAEEEAERPGVGNGVVMWWEDWWEEGAAEQQIANLSTARLKAV